MNLSPDLERWRHEIEGYARDTASTSSTSSSRCSTTTQMNQIAAYGGFPTATRTGASGWSTSSSAKSYTYGLSKIYEMVINNDPCYAYLRRPTRSSTRSWSWPTSTATATSSRTTSGSAKTNRKMMDEMANHATRVRRTSSGTAWTTVEDFIDACLSPREPDRLHAPFIERAATAASADGAARRRTSRRPRSRGSRARTTWSSASTRPTFLEEQKARHEAEREKRAEASSREQPERDVLLFLLEHAPLEHWERDILGDRARGGLLLRAPGA